MKVRIFLKIFKINEKKSHLIYTRLYGKKVNLPSSGTALYTSSTTYEKKKKPFLQLMGKMSLGSENILVVVESAFNREGTCPTIKQNE